MTLHKIKAFENQIDFFGINVIIFMENKFMRLIRRDRYLNQLINVIGADYVEYWNRYR